MPVSKSVHRQRGSDVHHEARGGVTSLGGQRGRATFLVEKNGRMTCSAEQGGRAVKEDGEMSEVEPGSILTFKVLLFVGWWYIYAYCCLSMLSFIFLTQL